MYYSFEVTCTTLAVTQWFWAGNVGGKAQQAHHMFQGFPTTGCQLWPLTHL